MPLQEQTSHLARDECGKEASWKVETAKLRDKLGVSPGYSPWTKRPSFVARGVSLTPRVKDLIDVVAAKRMKSHLGPVESAVSGVALDISQSHSRPTFTSKYGVCPCLTTASMLYSYDDDSLLSAREHMYLQGHPKSIQVPDALTARNLRQLAREGMALPCLGLCIAALVSLKPIPGP